MHISNTSHESEGKSVEVEAKRLQESKEMEETKREQGLLDKAGICTQEFTEAMAT